LKRLRYCKVVAFALAGIAFAGCAVTEPQTVYYVLTGSRSSAKTTRTQGALNIYVRRVEVPGYLSKPGLVTIRGGTAVEYANTSLWAEPLDQGLSRAIAEDLSQNSRLRAFGFSPDSPPPDHTYEVWIRLERFEGTDNGHAVLRARWWVSTAGSEEPIAGGTTEITRTRWRPGDYGTLVHLFRSELQEFSREIARAIP
jgi:uncharacterized protein